MLQKIVDILATSLSVLHNYFYSSTKLFGDLCLATFLNTSTEPFFLSREFSEDWLLLCYHALILIYKKKEDAVSFKR